MKTLKGKYKPKNPHKYVGNVDNIVYRSSYELKFMKWCDSHDDIIHWSSEELSIKYANPISGKQHRYFPDFIIKQRQLDGSIVTAVIEIKPKSQTTMPPKRKVTRKYVNEVVRYKINRAKWDAAVEFCKQQGFHFQILTEVELNIKR